MTSWKHPPPLQRTAEPDWDRADLSPADLDLMRATRWPRFGFELTVAIAEGWNAGVGTTAMARRLGCAPPSIRMLVGKLVQIGVTLRRADRSTAGQGVDADPVAPVVIERSPLAQAMAAEQFARLERLAKYDPAARRALDLYRRGMTLADLKTEDAA